MSEMINFLEEHGMNPNTTALIGHSIGAHAVGIAGYHTKTKVNHVIGKHIKSLKKFYAKLRMIIRT